jgi:hypothetical protein
MNNCPIFSSNDNSFITLSTQKDCMDNKPAGLFLGESFGPSYPKTFTTKRREVKTSAI